jgi:CheY-like chemotaxis protein
MSAATSTHGLPSVFCKSRRKLPFNLRILKRFLIQDGYSQIHTASNGEEGFNLYRKEQDRIKLVLMDNDMPIMNGIEATEKIIAWNREEGNREGVKIIGITGNVRDDQIAACLEAGMLRVMKKPVTLEELSKVLLCKIFL